MRGRRHFSAAHSTPISPGLRPGIDMEMMAPRKTKERLEHDRRILRKALRDFASSTKPHLDPGEQACMVESIRQRLVDLDARIAAIGIGEPQPSG
jgi:hypothetical protein